MVIRKFWLNVRATKFCLYFFRCNEIERYNSLVVSDLGFLNMSVSETFSATNASLSSYDNETRTNPDASFPDTYWYLYVFTAITCSVVLLSILRAVHMLHILVTASKHLHRKMLMSIMRAPISFFDSNPIGNSV